MAALPVLLPGAMLGVSPAGLPPARPSNEAAAAAAAAAVSAVYSGQLAAGGKEGCLDGPRSTGPARIATSASVLVSCWN